MVSSTLPQAPWGKDQAATLLRGDGVTAVRGLRGRIHGDHPGYVTRTSLYTRAVTNPGITMGSAGALLAVAAGAAVAMLAGGQNGSRA